MQTTLLGLAIAIILAIVAALVAPLVVDWNHYRTAFEAEASRLTGLNVRVNGTIDARILPTPRITLRDVAAGEAGREPKLRAGSLELEVGLGPLLRGEVRASEAHLIAPQISLMLDRSGAIDWPAPSPSFRPETLSISRLNIEDGKVILDDAKSGSRLVLQNLWFKGDIRSFIGPFNGEGAFVAGDALYGYRISGGRVEGDSGLRIRVGVDPSDHPLTADVEGTLILDHGVPQFDGTLALARPVGAMLANGQRVMSDPWHALGKLHATPAAASLQDVAFQYGPDERPVNFTGKAELTFGEHPHLDGTIAALQVNVDRALAAPDVTGRPPLLVIKDFAQAIGTVRLPVPAKIGIGVDELTIGGTNIESLNGDVRFDMSGWSLNHLEFRAPGLTQVNLSGRLEDTSQGVTFSGPATIKSADVNMLLSWLKRRSDLAQGQTAALSAHADLTIASDRIALDRLVATFDQENIDGRIAYIWATDNHPGILNADLSAADLDLDALTTFAAAAFADDEIVLPREGVLALDIGKATFAGVAARAVKAQAKIDAGILRIDRLSVGEVGGATLDVSGRIDELSSQPRGQMTFDLNASALAGLTQMIGGFAPKIADVLHSFADRLAPAKVHAVLTVARAATTGSTAKLDLSGQLGLMRIALNGDASGKSSHLGDAVTHIDGRLDADDGSALAALLGFDRVLAVDQLPGRLTLSAVGPLNGELRVDGRALASGLDAAVRGKLQLSGDSGPSATLQVLASAADLSPLHRMMTGQPGAAVPVSARATLAINGAAVAFTDLAIVAGKASLRGRVALNLATPIGVDGDLEADNANAASMLAMLLGLPAKESGGNGLWSSDPVGAGAFAPINGAVTFKLDRAVFTPSLIALNLKGVARFRPFEIALEDIDGSVAGGRLAAALAFRRNTDGLAAHGHVELTGANAAVLFVPDMNAVDGTVTIKLEGDGVGGNPAALVGALHGGGTIGLTDAHLAGLDATAFAAAMHAADQSGSIDAPKIQAVAGAAMANGRLAVPKVDAPVTMTAGELSLANVTMQTQDGSMLSLNGIFDLSNAAINARMTLSGDPPVNSLIRLRPELGIDVKGPFAAPARTLDTSALTSWLTLRAAELQTRRLESIEANHRDGATGPFARPASPVVRAAPLGAVDESAIANASAAAGATARRFDQLQPESVPPLPAPRAAGPDKRAPLDLSVRPQN